MADRLAAIKDPTKRAAMGTRLLGSSYRELEPLLENGGDGIQDLIDRASELGDVFGEGAVADAKANRRSIAELNIVFRGLRTTLATAILPVAVKLLKAAVPLALAIKELSTHTKLFEAAAMLLGTRGLFMLVGRLGGMAGALGKLLPMMKGIAGALFKWVIPLLILEDFLVFLKGGKSAFGEILDKIFGEGAAEKVRTAINAMLGGWDQLLEYAKAVWSSIELAVKIAVGELGFAFINLGSIVADIFAKIWNGVVDGAKWTVRQLAAASDAIGASDTAKRLRDFESSMDGAKGSADWSDQVVKDREKWRLKIAGEGDDIGSNWDRMLKASKDGKKAFFDPSSAKAADAPGTLTLDPITIAASPKGRGKTGAVTNNISNVTNVNVPPGTPETMLHRIGKETAKAAKKNNAATHAALVPGQG